MRSPKVIWITNPPCQQDNQALYNMIDTVLLNKVKNVGCQVFNSRKHFIENGVFPAKFKSNEINPGTGKLDEIHGNDLYYRELLTKLTDEQNLLK